VDERSKDDEVRFDRVIGAVGTVRRHAGNPPAIVAVDAVAHHAGEQFEVARPIRLRKLRHQDRRLRADMAPERLAKAAVGARWPSLISLRNDRAWRRERMIAKLSGRAVEDLAG